MTYAPQFEQTGSTVMRGRQLAEIARRAMPRREITYEPLRLGVRDSLIFLTKGALKAMTIEVLDDLKSGGNRLMFDVVDEAPPPYTSPYADMIVAASMTAFLDLSSQFPTIPIALVNHHVDPRITALAIHAPSDNLRMGYFGESVNAILSPKIEEFVTAVSVDTARSSGGWLERLPDFNAHYAVRATRSLDYAKPFLKGFTAAACGANILIQETEREALAWLGDDYPFLVRGLPTESNIVAAAQSMAVAFGGAEWVSALERMSAIRARIAPDRIGAELRSACA
jgi:hypothetical protein